MVVTRPLSSADSDGLGEEDSLVRLLRDRGAEVLHIPLTRIEPPRDPRPLRRAIARLSTFQWVVFTSARAVAPFVSALRSEGRALHELPPALRVAAVGPATARALESAGLVPEVVPDRFIAEGLLDHLLDHDVTGARILLPRAEEGRDVLPRALREHGADVEVVPVYRTVREPAAARRLAGLVEGGGVDALTFASGSAARSFGDAWGRARDWPSGVSVLVIGPAAAAVACEVGLPVSGVADPFTLGGLVEAVVRARAGGARPSGRRE